MRSLLLLLPVLGLLGASSVTAAGRPFFRAGLIFPPEHWHNHGSCLVETPRGDLLVCWFHGSGERTADDVRIEGARRRRGSARWGGRFTLADTPGFPDTNCAMVVDDAGRLWLFWPTILANLWESALLKYRVSEDFDRPGPPRWAREDVLHVKPGPEFAAAVSNWLATVDGRPLPAEWSEGDRREVERYLGVFRERAGDKLYARLGWLTRARPLVHQGRLLVPLYHDGFSCSLIAVTEDAGAAWRFSLPLLGGGNIQPSLVPRRDGSLHALMRDNGPPPARLHQADSRDGGLTWSPVTDSDLPNSGTGAELIRLRDGRWLLVNNDTEEGRHRLTVQLSADEGRTWPWRRPLEEDPPGPLAGRHHYPSALQTRDGRIHVTYSHHLSTAQALPLDRDGRPAAKSIKHAEFDLAWIEAGGAPPR